MAEINSLKGFYDRYPEEWQSWKRLIQIVDEAAEEYGFKEINTPNVEKADLYRMKSGEELMDQMYNFNDKSGREISLIPEQTPTRARLVQQRKDLKKPVKWYDTSKRWRYENVQKGRDREFFQGDFDIFGVKSVEADAEIIATASEIFRKLNVMDRVKFKINNRNLLENILDSEGVQKKEAVMKIIDDKEKMEKDEFVENIVELGIEKEIAENIDKITNISGPISETTDLLQEKTSEEVQDEVKRLNDLKNYLESYDVAKNCILDLSIVRGLQYYTGLVFEAFDSKGELRALFGGGRYDDLVGMFGSQDVPAVGFAFGYSTTVELLKKEDKWPLETVKTDIYVLNVSSEVRNKAVNYANELRKEGFSVETSLTDRGFGEQLDYANSVNAENVLIVGERDLKEGKVTIKNMETGNEVEISKDKVVEHFKN